VIFAHQNLISNWLTYAKSTGELISFGFSDRSSEVWSQVNAQLIAVTKRKKNDFTFWLIFGLSPNLGLGETLSERLIQKVKWPAVGCRFGSQQWQPTADTDARQPSAKNLEKKKRILGLVITSHFVENKNEEKTQNFSKETTLATIIDRPTNRDKSTQLAREIDHVGPVTGQHDVQRWTVTR